MEDVSVNLSKDVASIFRDMVFLNVQNDFFCLEINERRNFKPSLSLEYLHRGQIEASCLSYRSLGYDCGKTSYRWPIVSF